MDSLLVHGFFNGELTANNGRTFQRTILSVDTTPSKTEFCAIPLELQSNPRQIDFYPFHWTRIEACKLAAFRKPIVLQNFISHLILPTNISTRTGRARRFKTRVIKLLVAPLNSNKSQRFSVQLYKPYSEQQNEEPKTHSGNSRANVRTTHRLYFNENALSW